MLHRRANSDRPFVAGLAVLGGAYVLLIVAMVLADAAYTSPDDFWRMLASPEIRYAIKLSLISCSLSALLSLWVAVPLGYLMSRYRFPGHSLVDAILDIPIVLPPLILGLSLLILFQTPPGRAIERLVPVTYAVPSVILAQFSVACAFAVRTMRVTFDQRSIHERPGIPFVGIAYQVFRLPGGITAELPFLPGRETGAAASAQA